MEIDRPQFVPKGSLDRDEMSGLQTEIADCARFEDDLTAEPGPDERQSPERVAGVDQAFDDETVVSAAVVYSPSDGAVLERAVARVETTQPYVPGLLSFREGPAVLAALRELDREPAVVLVDGSGRIHPREAGLATHVGVTLGVPTVGVAKGLLCGRPTRSLETPLPAGARVPIVADGSVTAPAGTTIGYAVQTRQYDSETRHINPVYTSPGHRVSAATAADLVAETSRGYKLPEPIRLADAHADRVS